MLRRQPPHGKSSFLLDCPIELGLLTIFLLFRYDIGFCA
jgi:hypothetical protein